MPIKIELDWSNKKVRSSKTFKDDRREHLVKYYNTRSKERRKIADMIGKNVASKGKCRVIINNTPHNKNTR